MLIPPEVLQIVSVHLTQKEGLRPTWFDVPPSYHLYCLMERLRENRALAASPQPLANVKSITLATTQRNSPTRSDFVSVLWKQTFSKRKSRSDAPKVACAPEPKKTATDKRSSFDIKPIRRRYVS